MYVTIFLFSFSQIMCTYHKEKKKEKRIESNCGNGIAEIGGEKSPPISVIPLPQLLSPLFFFFSHFRQWYFGNPIATILLLSLFFFKKW